MPAPATVSVRRAAKTEVIADPVDQRRPAPGAPGDERSTWNPLSEQSVLAALATLVVPS